MEKNKQALTPVKFSKADTAEGRYLTGFTLIELLVVCAIIALMTILTIPLFSRYGVRSEFNLRSIEIKSLIEQASIMSKNPELNVSRYLIKYDPTNATVDLYRTSDSTANLIKELKMSSDFAINTNGADSTEQAKHYLVCDTPGESCCRVANSTDTCSPTLKVSNTNFFNLVIIGDPSFTKTFTLNSNPFRVNP